MDIACATLLVLPTSTTIKSETESQIQHFLHGHPLSLRDKDVNDQVASCRVCMKSSTGPTYVCGRPSSDYCHGHLLRFRDDNIENSKLECGACKSDISESYAFTCLYCDLNLHFLCGPLPYIIKHEDHNTHPLFLANSPVQEEVEDETHEFYCHACEEERDPQLPVYYCAKCYFVAEFKCVFSQVT
nr:hypothetical protein CFP56_29288 [Quercus suber]